jgi:hypothetical protein
VIAKDLRQLSKTRRLFVLHDQKGERMTNSSTNPDAMFTKKKSSKMLSEIGKKNQQQHVKIVHGEKRIGSIHQK